MKKILTMSLLFLVPFISSMEELKLPRTTLPKEADEPFWFEFARGQGIPELLVPEYVAVKYLGAPEEIALIIAKHPDVDGLEAHYNKLTGRVILKNKKLGSEKDLGKIYNPDFVSLPAIESIMFRGPNQIHFFDRYGKLQAAMKTDGKRMTVMGNNIAL